MASLEVAYDAGMKIVDAETVRKSLAPNIDSLKANLQRQGFSEKLLCEILDLKKSEIRKFFKNKLPENKMYEIHLDLLRLGITQKKTG